MTKYIYSYIVNNNKNIVIIFISFFSAGMLKFINQVIIFEQHFTLKHTNKKNY